MPLEMTRRMLGNPFYAGRLRWNGAEYSGNHESLIPDALFMQVQQTLRARHRDCGEKGRKLFLLRGIAQCEECKGRLTAQEHQRGSYYRFTRRLRCTSTVASVRRSEEHTSELQSRLHL